MKNNSFHYTNEFCLLCFFVQRSGHNFSPCWSQDSKWLATPDTAQRPEAGSLLRMQARKRCPGFKNFALEKSISLWKRRVLVSKISSNCYFQIGCSFPFMPTNCTRKGIIYFIDFSKTSTDYFIFQRNYLKWAWKFVKILEKRDLPRPLPAAPSGRQPLSRSTSRLQSYLREIHMKSYP